MGSPRIARGSPLKRDRPWTHGSDVRKRRGHGTHRGGKRVMVEVDEPPKEREVSMGDAGRKKRDEESRRTFDHHPLIGTFSFPYSSFASLFSLLFSFICCPLLSNQLRTKRDEEQRDVERQDSSRRMSWRKRNVGMQVGTRRNGLMRVFREKKRESRREHEEA